MCSNQIVRSHTTVVEKLLVAELSEYNVDWNLFSHNQECHSLHPPKLVQWCTMLILLCFCRNPNCRLAWLLEKAISHFGHEHQLAWKPKTKIVLVIVNLYHFLFLQNRLCKPSGSSALICCG